MREMYKVVANIDFMYYTTNIVDYNDVYVFCPAWLGGRIMKYEDKRIIDAEITKKFLRDNADAIDKIIAEFSSVINEEFLRHHELGNDENEYNFYLKGGNALSVLDGKAPTGDFDFQLVPPAAVYNNWTVRFRELDEIIVTVLQHTVERLANLPDPIVFNEESFLVDTLEQWAREENNPIHINNIDLAGIERLERRQNIMFIGRNNGTASYANIIRRRNPESMRLEDDSVDFRFREFQFGGAEFGPSIYVNYTIPGFILYRMVYCYKYRIADTTFSLKSEIIDVSIPRLGSAEIFLSQKGNITYFRRSPVRGHEFNIPGWGYHFYENINLLQEINLGLSGSPHKMQKRIERLELAMAKLEEANATVPGKLQLDDILSQEIKEPNETLPRGYEYIRGYLGALTLNIADYRRYNLNMIEHVKVTSYLQTKSLFETFKSHHSKNYKDWKKLVFYKLKSSFDQTICNSQDLRSLIGLFTAGFKRYRSDFQYKFLTPMLGDAGIPLKPEDIFDFPFNYVVIGINEQYFDAFYDYCCSKVTSERIHPPRRSDNMSAFVCAENTTKGTKQKFSLVFYLIFQKFNDEIDMKNITEEFLKKCICESQRHAVSDALYHLLKEPD